MSKCWDNSILKKLKTLVGRGLSTAEIGKRLGMSKNAVVGKLHRMGWNGGATESPRATKTSVKKTAAKPATKTATKKTTAAKPIRGAKTHATPKVKESKKKTPVAAAPKKVGKAIAIKTKSANTPRGASANGLAVHQRIVQHALEMANLKPNQCRWPIGDPDSEGFHFCGQPVFVGKPYCYEHCRQAYQFAPVKKK